MINYIIQIVLCQVLFLAVYDLFLSKETFFTKNRLYLISTAILSFVLPLLRIPTLQKAVPQEYVILLPEVMLSPQKVIEQSSWYENINYLQVLFWLGVVVFSIVFILKLTTILRLIFSNEIHPKKNYKLVWLPKNSKAFSFFNYIFLGRGIPQEKQEKIIQHELVHSEQKHSLDLLFFELLKIVMWFNPMIYVYQKRIALVHEFISDEVVTKHEEKTSYINNLLSEIFQVEHISFINQFYKHSLIKKRVVMLTKNKSKQVKQLKYLLLVPVLASVLLYTACTNNEVEMETLSKKETKTFYFEVDGKLQANKKNEESYLDALLSTKTEEQFTFPEIKYSSLSKEEKEEYDQALKRLSKVSKELDSKFVVFETKIVQMPNGRKAIASFPNFKKVRNMSFENEDNQKLQTIHEDVPYNIIDKAPMFPESNARSKSDFNKSMREFVKDNFDHTIVDELNFSKGKKRIWTVFKIDRNGEVIDLQVRAPHPKLKEQALQMMRKLPKFIPAEHNGMPVRVAYQLPITFVVE